MADINLNLNIQGMAEEIGEMMYAKLIRTVVKNDEQIMRLLSSFHDVGVKWETIMDATIIFAEKSKEKKEKESRDHE